LTGHVHEREASFQLGVPVQFIPHVAPHFRGLTVTTNVYLSRQASREEVLARFRDRYGGERLVRVVDEPPWVSRVAGRHHVEIGGFGLSADGRRVVIVAALDNLLKGAATQAMQNVNLALGLGELAGIPQERGDGRWGAGARVRTFAEFPHSASIPPGSDPGH
jgi:N-acetyl-gamma-glutamyl-phosphate reductase